MQTRLNQSSPVFNWSCSFFILAVSCIHCGKAFLVIRLPDRYECGQRLAAPNQHTHQRLFTWTTSRFKGLILENTCAQVFSFSVSDPTYIFTWNMATSSILVPAVHCKCSVRVVTRNRSQTKPNFLFILTRTIIYFLRFMRETVEEEREERNFVGAEMEVFTNGHLNGSTGADSSRRAAASKHSVASCNEAAEPLALWSTPRLYHAEWFILSSRNASIRKLRRTAGDWFPSCLRTTAVEIKLGTWVGSISKASRKAFSASL